MKFNDISQKQQNTALNHLQSRQEAQSLQITLATNMVLPAWVMMLRILFPPPAHWSEFNMKNSKVFSFSFSVQMVKIISSIHVAGHSHYKLWVDTDTQRADTVFFQIQFDAPVTDIQVSD